MALSNASHILTQRTPRKSWKLVLWTWPGSDWARPTALVSAQSLLNKYHQQNRKVSTLTGGQYQDNTKSHEIWATLQSSVNSTQTWERYGIRVQDGKLSQ
jgi:hypothetical protein